MTDTLMRYDIYNRILNLINRPDILPHSSVVMSLAIAHSTLSNVLMLKCVYLA